MSEGTVQDPFVAHNNHGRENAPTCASPDAGFSAGGPEVLHVCIEVGPTTDRDCFARLVGNFQHTCRVTLLHPLPSRWYEWFAPTAGLPQYEMREQAHRRATQLCRELECLIPVGVECKAIIGSRSRRRKRQGGGQAVDGDVIILTRRDVAASS
jgi:hypothetical protein